MTFPVRQVALLSLLIGIGVPVIFATMEQAALNTALLWVFISVAGLVLCRNTQAQLNDPSLNVMGYFWLIKLGLTLFLLYVSWIPVLGTDTGYDPVRYYSQANELVKNNWAPDLLNLNYVGILYYYGAIFYMFGHNPVIPALINALITLIASLYLIKVGYEIKGLKEPHDWTLALVILLPEMLWYDAITSRETLIAALLLFAMLCVGRYVARIATLSLFKVFTVVGLSALCIAAVRTSMLLPLFTSILLMVLLVKCKQKYLVKQRLFLVGITFAILIIGPIVNSYTGGYAFNIVESIKLATSASENIAQSTDVTWSENSIGMLLLPEGWLQSVLFLPPRMVLYLVAPLPNVYKPIGDLLSGNVQEWQTLLILLSSMINLIAIPYAMASLVHAFKTRKINAKPLVFHISYWITFISIAGGNLIIHERYRVMATPLLCGCVWLGVRTCPKRLTTITLRYWYGVLTLSAVFFLTYKIIL